MTYLEEEIEWHRNDWDALFSTFHSTVYHCQKSPCLFIGVFTGPCHSSSRVG